MKQPITIYWIRRDFRLADNPALSQAIKDSKANNTPFLPMYILDDGILSDNPHPHIGYPRRLFLSRILSHFASQFERFEIFKGNPNDIFANLARDFELSVYANDDVEAYSRKRDVEISKLVKEFHLFNDQLTVSRKTVSGTGNPYTVFTPFKKAVWKEFITTKPLEKPTLTHIDYFVGKLPKPLQTIEKTESLQKAIFERIDTKWQFDISGHIINLDEIWKRQNYDQWSWEEDKIVDQFSQYLVGGKMSNYKKNRDDLGLDTQENGQTTKMSVPLKWGLISSRSLKEMTLNYFKTDFENPFSITNDEGASHFISELIWREFYRYILYLRPEILNLEFQSKYQNTIKWEEDPVAFERFIKWIKGETGYPVVDAAMHQIAQTGWMHNRSRMIVASILTKNLGVDWRWGQEYFRAALLDLDEASNNGGWQWGASVGADPKPIRIFNPYLQEENYDKNKEYLKKWLPKNYVAKPIIEHPVARNEAMIRYGLGKNFIADRNY
jgi:deoxyribodipyrimidine photo-lyase